MTSQAPQASRSSSTSLPFLTDNAWCEQAAANATGRSVEAVRERLAKERRDPGSNVADEIARRGVTPFEWSDQLLAFYGESDAFIYELVEWNRKGFKRSMRTWTRQFLAREAERRGGPLKVLCHGDGLGIDAASLAVDGHAVTYFEFAGPSERFARQAFEAANVSVEVVTDESVLPAGAFDAVTCFDVLEHVPSPRKTVEQLVGYLRPGGLFVVHAPYYLIHRRYPTHLRSNRRYAGSLRLYERNDLRLLDGQTAWNPLAFRLGSEEGAAAPAKRVWLRTAGLGLKVGRYTTAPFVPLQAMFRR